MGERAQRNLSTAGGAQVDVVELARIALKLRRDFQHHVILVELGEHGRDLALPECIVERVVDGRGRDAEARGGIAIDHQMRASPCVLLIGRDIAQRGSVRSLSISVAVQVLSSAAFGIFEAVLILGAAHAIFDRQILHRLHDTA